MLDQPLATFQPSRQAALKRLAGITSLATDTEITARRKTDGGEGVRQATSLLSPYIRHRVITEQEILASILRTGNRRKSTVFIEGLFWRAYWKGWLELRPHVWDVFDKSVTDLIERAGGDPSSTLYGRALVGATGIDCFDAWARELSETGYLHHQARRAYASIWVHTLRLPWELGADHMERHLLDGDPAINLLSWRWVAGLQDGRAPQLVSQEDIGRVFKGRFRPTGLAAAAAEIGRRGLPGPSSLPPARSLRNAYRAPGLLVTLEDLRPEDLVPAEVGIRGIAILPDAAPSDARRHSSLVRRFRAGLIEDAAARLAAFYGAPVTILGEFSGDAAVAWARSVGLSDVLVPYTPIGLARRLMKDVRASLGDTRVRLRFLRRGWDSVIWVHSRHTYPTFRGRIPGLTGLLGNGEGSGPRNSGPSLGPRRQVSPKGGAPVIKRFAEPSRQTRPRVLLVEQDGRPRQALRPRSDQAGAGPGPKKNR